MKVIKSNHLSLLHRTFERDGKCHFTVSILAYFPLTQSRALLPEVALWAEVVPELGKGEALDECMAKSRAEALLTGYAFTPGKKQSTACSVRLQIGQIDKTLYAVGDRQWKHGVASKPDPFSKMPIAWATAFGGADFANNPLGKGAAPTEVGGQIVQALPNIEYPKHLVKAPGDRPVPASFSGLDISWPQRATKSGTYDARWLEECYPGYPADIDWAIFNTASADQQQDGFFDIAQSFVLENLHADMPRIEGRLPGVVARCFITRRGAEDRLCEVATHIDTVRFFPHLDRGLAIYRGVVEVIEDDADDVVHILAAFENPQQPKSLGHYETVLAQRLDKEQGALHALRDSDLMPENLESPLAASADPLSVHQELVRSDNLMAANMRRNAEHEIDEMREKMRAMGIDPDEHEMPELATIEEAPSVDEMADYIKKQRAIASKEEKAAKELAAQQEADARALCAEHGKDYDAIVAEARNEAAGPPKFSALEEQQKLRDTAQLLRNIGQPDQKGEAELKNAEVFQKLQLAQDQLRETYRKYCHHFPAASALAGESGGRVRDLGLQAIKEGLSFAERDFSGADFSGVDMRSAKLQNAWLEAAHLSGVDLRDVDLRNAVLARANLSGADLRGANLEGANLGEADLSDANLSGANLKGAVLTRAKMSRTDFSKALMDGVDFSEAIFDLTRLCGAKMQGAIFHELDMSGIDATGADFSKCNFIESSLKNAVLANANLEGCNFVTVDGTGARFDKAIMASARFVSDCIFNRARFQGAKLDHSNFRGTALQHANFGDAVLDGCDFSECDLSEAIFDLATAREALFVRSNLSRASLVRTNLMHAILQKANVAGANFAHANLFRSDFAKIRGNDETNFEGANMTQIRFVKPAEQAVLSPDHA